jgi:hypothetical protein
MDMARPPSKSKTTTQVLDLIKESGGRRKYKRCAFCDKEASDSIPMHDLNLEFRKELPRQQQRLISLPICETHFNKYVIRPQIKANMKVIRRIDRTVSTKKKK